MLHECTSFSMTNVATSSQLLKDDSDSLSSDDDSSLSSSSTSDDEPVLATRARDGSPGLTRGGMVTGGRPGLTRGGLVPRGDSKMSQSRRNLMALASTGRSSRNLMVFEDTAEDDPIYQRMQALLMLQKQLGIDKDTAFLAEHDKRAEEKERLMAMTPEERIAHQQKQLDKEMNDFGSRLRELRQKQSERKLVAEGDEKSDDDDDDDETDVTSEEDDTDSEAEEEKGALHKRYKQEDGYVSSSVRKLETRHEKAREEQRALVDRRAAGSVRATSERNLSSKRTGYKMDHSQKPKAAMQLTSKSAHSKSTRCDALGGPSAASESNTVIPALELSKVGKFEVSTSSQRNERREQAKFPSECMPSGSKLNATKNTMVDGDSSHQKHKKITNTLKDSKHLKQEDEKRKLSCSKRTKDTKAKVSDESRSSSKGKDDKNFDESRSISRHSKDNDNNNGREKSPSLATRGSKHDKSKHFSDGLGRGETNDTPSSATAKKESSSHKINGIRPDQSRPMWKQSASVKERKGIAKNKDPESVDSSTHTRKKNSEILRNKDRKESKNAPKAPGRDSSCREGGKQEATISRKKNFGDDPEKKKKSTTPSSHGTRRSSEHERKSSEKGEQKPTKKMVTTHDSGHEKKKERSPKFHRKSSHDSEKGERSTERRKSSKKTKD